ncbi:MAG: hypothetical protein RLZZ416_265 [Candidatus Parcubacteria bacterium]
MKSDKNPPNGGFFGYTHIVIALVFGLFGLIIGSFLNVLILRYDARTLRGRSQCPRCARQLRWYEMIPVFSWIFLRGRCGGCKERISIQYPLVELFTAVAFALIGGAPFPGYEYRAIFCAIAALLIAIAVYDLYHTIIPDAWVYTFDALAFLSIFPPFGALLQSDQSMLPYLLAGPLSALPLFALWMFSRGAWMGFGDVKLALGIGWLLGPVHGLASIVLAFIIGGVVSIPLLVVSSERWRSFMRDIPLPVSPWGKAISNDGPGFTMKSEIPFGPFLICSCFILWYSMLYGFDLLARLFPLQ